MLVKHELPGACFKVRAFFVSKQKNIIIPWLSIFGFGRETLFAGHNEEIHLAIL